MKKQKNSPVSHNVRYAYHHKSLFNDPFIPFRLVDKYILRTDTKIYDVMIYKGGNFYFYRLVDDSSVCDSCCFSSLDECLYAVRNFASIVKGKLRLFI